MTNSSLKPNVVHSAFSLFFPNATIAEILYFRDAPVLHSAKRESEALARELAPVFRSVAALKHRGIVKGIEFQSRAYHDEPRIIRFAIAPVGNFGQIGSSGVGKSFFRVSAALRAAYGEAIERISLFTFRPEKAAVASPSELGALAVRLEDFAGANAETRAKIETSPVFRQNHPKTRLSFDDKSRFEWVQSHSLLENNAMLLPLQLVSLAHRHKPEEFNEPVIRFPLSTGAACGETFDDAVLAGILELIERDGYMIMWLNQLSPEKLDLSSFPEGKFLSETFERYGLELHIVSMLTDFGIPAFLGVGIDRGGVGPAVVVGAKAGFNLSDLLDGVASDIVNSRSSLRKNAPPKHKHINLTSRAYRWWPRGRIRDIETLIGGPKKPLDYFEKKYAAACALLDTSSRLRFLKGRLAELGLDAYWTDITADTLRFLKNPVVMVVIPALQPLYVDECFPYAVGERLKTVPKKFGYQPLKTSPAFSHPFA